MGNTNMNEPRFRRGLFVLRGSDSVGHCHVGTCKILRSTRSEERVAKSGPRNLLLRRKQEMFLAKPPPQQSCDVGNQYRPPSNRVRYRLPWSLKKPRKCMRGFLTAQYSQQIFSASPILVFRSNLCCNRDKNPAFLGGGAGLALASIRRFH